MEKLIVELTGVLDSMVNDILTCPDPEWYKLNAVRFVEKYALMRALQSKLAENGDD